MSNIWQTIVKLATEHNVPLTRTSKANKFHVAKSDITSEFEDALRQIGGRLAPVYNEKYVVRPSIIEEPTTTLQLNNADKTLTPYSSTYARESAPFRKRQLEADSMAIAVGKALGRAHSPKPRRLTDEELTAFEGDVRGGNHPVASRALTDKVLNDPALQKDAIHKIISDYNAAGDISGAEKFRTNLMERYGIDIDLADFNEPAREYGNAIRADVIGASVPDIVSGHYQPSRPEVFIEKLEGPDVTGYHASTYKRSRYIPKMQSAPYFELSEKLKTAQDKLQGPFAPAKTLKPGDPRTEELTWLPIYGDGAYNIGYITPDGKYYKPSNYLEGEHNFRGVARPSWKSLYDNELDVPIKLK